MRLCVLVGLSGIELVQEVYSRTGETREWPAPRPVFNLSSAYWAGWTLAYAQWWSARSLRSIVEVVPLSEIIGMYGPLHEESENRFVDHLEALIAERRKDAPLKIFRKLRNWSQLELAKIRFSDRTIWKNGMWLAKTPRIIISLRWK